MPLHKMNNEVAQKAAVLTQGRSRTVKSLGTRLAKPTSSKNGKKAGRSRRRIFVNYLMTYYILIQETNKPSVSLKNNLPVIKNKYNSQRIIFASKVIVRAGRNDLATNIWKMSYINYFEHQNMHMHTKRIYTNEISWFYFY